MKKIKKYTMCESQLAQIDCRREKCTFQKTGHCSNISPALTLNNKTYVCWSFLKNFKDLEDEA